MALGHYDKAPTILERTLRLLKIYRINYFEYKRLRDSLFIHDFESNRHDSIDYSRR